MKRVLLPLSLSPIVLDDPSLATLKTLRGETMGTTWSVTLVTFPTHSLPALQHGIQLELDRIVEQMSTWLWSSDLSRFNRAPAGAWHVLQDEFATVLRYALEVTAASGGAYDPTVGPLVNLWGFGPGGGRGPRAHEGTGVFGAPRGSVRPTQAAIDAALARRGADRIVIDAGGRRAQQPGDVYLDFSGIAKGYAVDLVARYLHRCGIDNFLVEIGGELRGSGGKPDNQPWWVALESPEASARDDGLPDTILALHGLSVATSGDYRRYFEEDDVRYAHTIDPRTGAPVRHALASVTVVHPDCMVADAQSTALTVLGVDAGMAYARHYSLAARFVTRTRAGGFEEHLSPALAAMLDE